jgi:hypothetical protein
MLENRPLLDSFNRTARDSIAARLEKLGRTWNWLAVQASDNGICCRAAITHWGSGRVAQIGCGAYLACMDIVLAEEQRREQPIRIQERRTK